MIKKTIITGLVVTLLAGIGSFSVMAKEPTKKDITVVQTRVAKRSNYLKALNLTAEQQQKIMSIRHNFQKEILPLRQAKEKGNLELRQLWAAKPLNQQAIERKAKEIAVLNVQIKLKHLAMREEIKTVLTAEQLRILETKRSQNSAKKFRGKK